MRVSLIYLAAGNSRRFGTNKLLYSLEGNFLYRHLLDRLMRICTRHPKWEIVVVTQYPEIAGYVRSVGDERVRAVLSPDSHKGASYSIRAGLKAAKSPEACAFFVADQPYLTEQTAENFLLTMEKSHARLGCVSCQGDRGNPVWFSREYFSELEKLEGDQGGRKVLGRHLGEAALFAISEKRELVDVDTL